MVDIKEILPSPDAIEKIRRWKSDIELCDMIMSRPSLLSIDETNKWIKKNTEDQNQLLFGIYAEGILKGIVRLMFINEISGTAEVGIYIGTDSHRGLGLGKASLQKIIQVAKEEKHLNKLYARIRGLNEASLKLFKSQGFSQEGFLKNHYKSLISGSYDNVIYLGKFLKA